MHHSRVEQIYRLMAMAREIDIQERVLISQNRAHFHVSGAGHEATATVADHLTLHDWLHLHYRDKALLLARGLPVGEFFRSLLCRANSHSAGRQMSAHFSARRLNVLSMVGPVGNNALQAVGVAAAVKHLPERPIVVCSVGDGTTQQGEFLEAVAEAVRSKLPVLFLIEDNRYAISTRTEGRTFFDLPAGSAAEFYGLCIERVDGSDPQETDRLFADVVARIRNQRAPQLVVMRVERLLSHTNADDQQQYRSASDITDCREKRDPLQNQRRCLLRAGYSPDDLDAIDVAIQTEVRKAVEDVAEQSEPLEQTDAKAPLTAAFLKRTEYRGKHNSPQVTMQTAINSVLRHQLQSNSNVFLYGQDIEDPKGDVFGITRSLSTEFPGQVVNSPLSEATIVGTCIGRALAGQRPVAFIQFADFLPLACNQILSELGSMHWRTNGDWQCPVILMVTCGGYKPGLGPFHAQTLESLMAHTPGIDVVMPSSAGDAAGLLNAAFESGRPTVFLYPKSCLNLTDRTTSQDVEQQFVPLGAALKLRSGDDLTLVSWGGSLTPCLRAVDALTSNDMSVDLFDLRSISPWDRDSIAASAERTGRLVVVHEDNRTCGFGAEIIATIVERTSRRITCRRVTRPDVFIPCNFSNQLRILPSFRTVLETCAELVNYDVVWQTGGKDEEGISVIHAASSGPSDEWVEVMELLTQPGDKVKPGDVVALIEASKSVVEIAALEQGTIIEVCAKEDDLVEVGSVLFRVQTGNGGSIYVPSIHEESGTPSFVAKGRKNSHLRTDQEPMTTNNTTANTDRPVFLSRPVCVLGSRSITSQSLAANIDGWTEEDVIARTGVAVRCWVDDGESSAEMALRVARQLFEKLGSNVPPVMAVVCSTTSPQEATPSIACQVAAGLSSFDCFADNWFAYDFNAACSGFLYGLRFACDHLSIDVQSVLLLTAERLSPMIDKTDPTTAFLFGDAFSATLVSRKPVGNAQLRVEVPVVQSRFDPDRAIYSPCVGASGSMVMDGVAVARVAYKEMANTLIKACEARGVAVNELTYVVPHPGSLRIIRNVAKSLQVPEVRLLHTLAETGNTSSTSIPLTLERSWDTFSTGDSVGMVAFGAGFTSAAAIGKFL